MFVIELIIFALGFWASYWMGIRRGYQLGYEEALLLKIKQYLTVERLKANNGRADADEQNKGD